MALGLLQLAWIGAGAGACAAWATTVGAAPPPAALVAAAGVSSVVTATGVACCCSSVAAWAGAGAAPVRDAFCRKMAPKIAAHTTIASVDAIAARRMSDLQAWDAASPGTQQTRVSAHILKATLSGQFEAESTAWAIIRPKAWRFCPASWGGPRAAPRPRRPPERPPGRARWRRRCRAR